MLSLSKKAKKMKTTQPNTGVIPKFRDLFIYTNLRKLPGFFQNDIGRLFRQSRLAVSAKCYLKADLVIQQETWCADCNFRPFSPKRDVQMQQDLRQK